MDPIVDDLNPAQREAVEYGEGPLMVLAGAGSGKTRVITRRIARLLREGVPASSILALTFTNKAAGEMAHRVEQLGGRRVLVSTFHSTCARFLRDDGERIGFPRDFSIYDTQDRDACLKLLMQEHGLDRENVKSSAVGRRISQLKNLGVTPDELVVGYSPVDRIVERLFGPYQQMMLRLGAMDFDDLIAHFLQLLAEFPDVAEAYQQRFPWLLVDEFQDTNRVQYDLLKRMVGGSRNLCVVGDPDQSIYRFRGAEVRNILDFQHDYADTHVVRLEQNYRSTATILRAAEGVIENNEERLDKRLVTENDDGTPLVVHRSNGPHQEARQIATVIDSLVGDGVEADEIAVFYRSHYLSRGIEEGLREIAIPYRIVGGVSFFERREIKDLLAYVRVLVNPLDDVSMERIVNVPPRGIGRVSLDKLRRAAIDAGMSLYEGIGDPGVRGVLSGKAKKGIENLAAALEKARPLVAESAHAPMKVVADGVDYLAWIGDSGDPEDEARRENLAELFNDAMVFDEEHGGGLAGYLQHVSLMTSADREQGEQGPRVSLMTVHAAKGLEFDHVFVAGLEEGLFPSQRALEEAGGLEEERRLMYVALTRARQSLWLGYVDQRMVAGRMQGQEPSSFLREIPPDCMAASDQYDEPWSEPDAFSRDVFGDDSNAGDIGGGGSFEPDYSQEQPSFGPGVRVVHPAYGYGSVVRMSGQGTMAKATVRFDDSGERTLILEYAGLRVVPAWEAQ